MPAPNRNEAQRRLEETLQEALRDRPEIKLRATDMMRGVRAQLDHIVGTHVSNPTLTSADLFNLMICYHNREQDKSLASQQPINRLIRECLRKTIETHQWMTPEALAEMDASFVQVETKRRAEEAQQAQRAPTAQPTQQVEPEKKAPEPKVKAAGTGQTRPRGTGYESWGRRVQGDFPARTTSRRTPPASLEAPPPPHPHLIEATAAPPKPVSFQPRAASFEPPQPLFSLDKLKVELEKDPDSETLKDLYMKTWFHIETLSILVGTKGVLDTITDKKIPDIELPEDAFFARMEAIKAEARVHRVLVKKKEKETEAEVPDRYQLAVALCLEAINDLYSLYACALKKENGRER